MNRHFSRQFLSFVLVIGGGSANASCGREEDLCVDPSLWVSAHAATVRYAEPQGRDFSEWQFTFAGNYDMHIEPEIRTGDQLTRGAIMLVSGRAMLTKGLALERGYELDVMDVPVFMYRLVVSLLAHAIPDGPETFRGVQQIDIEETERALRVATQGSSMRYEPPWRIKGRVERKDEATVTYSLTLTHSGKPSPEPMVLSGSWSRNALYS